MRNDETENEQSDHEDKIGSKEETEMIHLKK